MSLSIQRHQFSHLCNQLPHSDPDLQACREGGGGEGRKVFPGPATFWRLRQRSKIMKRVFQMSFFWPQICIKSISPGPRWGSLRCSLRLIVGCWGDIPPHVSSLLFLITPRMEWGCEGPTIMVSGAPLRLSTGLQSYITDATVAAFTIQHLFHEAFASDASSYWLSTSRITCYAACLQQWKLTGSANVNVSYKSTTPATNMTSRKYCDMLLKSEVMQIIHKLLQ